jgi:hypothetical protein
LGLSSRVHQLLFPRFALGGRLLPHELGVLVDRGGGDGRSPFGCHFGGPILQLRAEPLTWGQSPKQPDRNLPLAGLRMTSVVRAELNQTHTGFQRYGLITGLLQSLAGERTERPLFIGHLLQTLLESLTVPLSGLAFDLLFNLPQAGLGFLAHATSFSQADCVLGLWSRWRNCRCRG